MSTCDIICITHRTLCKEPFLQRMAGIIAAQPAAILLREKDLPPRDYQALAQQVLELAGDQVPVILHSYPDVALTLGCPRLHLPLPLLRTLSPQQRSAFQVLGASCHSVDEAKEAQALGCTYITAGHVFETSCKPGLAARGLTFLQHVTQAVSIHVWAIGGVMPENISRVRSAGAAGGCVMSGFMACDNPKTFVEAFSQIPM